LPGRGGGAGEVGGGGLVGGGAGGAVDQEQRLLGVGQRHQQGVVAPGAVVGQVHPLLALPGGAHQRPVGLEDGPLEEGGGLLPPDLDALPVQDARQRVEVRGGEAAQEV